MEKLSKAELKYNLASIAAVAVLGLVAYFTSPHPDPRETALRDQVLSGHNFTPAAVYYVSQFPFDITYSSTITQGGGLAHFNPPSIEVYSEQPEAIVHESAHLLCDKLEKENPQFDDILTSEAHYAARHETNPYFRVLYFGYGSFPGNANRPNELCADIASYDMGRGIMPGYLKPLYTTIYQFQPDYGNQTTQIGK